MKKLSRSDRLPAILLVPILLSLPIGVAAAALTGREYIGRLTMIGLGLGSVGVWELWRRTGSRTPNGTNREASTDDDVWRGQSQTRPGDLSRCVWALGGLGALFLGLGVVAVGSYFGQYSFITLVGGAAVLGFWRQREADNFRAAAAFVGLFVALYGVLAMALQFLAS